jgi:hypothetical protein
MLELVKIDPARGDQVRQLGLEAEVVRPLEPPAEDPRILSERICERRLKGVHSVQRVALRGCRSDVEMRSDFHERPHELSTSELWETLGVRRRLSGLH